MSLIAMDSETQDGYAILLTKPTSFAEPGTWNECVEFLETDKEMMCWNSDYDCQACLKYLPKVERARLAIIGEVRHKEFWIKYVPHKFMRVWRKNARTDKLYHLFTIYDLKQFYNCSLAAAAEQLGVQSKFEIPQHWYRNMRKYLNDPRTRARLLEYALGDSQTLQQIINKTVEAFALAGLKFVRPFSNASFAERYFHKEFRHRRNFKAEKAARSAYHGGRIECKSAGTFPVAYNIDVHSAYPSIIARLERPDGEWIYEKRSEYIRSDAKYAFVDCQIRIPKSENVGPIPYRRQTGSIIYPVGTFRKTITLTEFRYLEKRGWIDKIFSAWVHIWTKGVFPFREIYELYQRRKEDPRVDYALKIVMNATYGKFAQILEDYFEANFVDSHSSIFDGRVWRKRERWKAHTSFVYAAEITARMRIRLLEDVPAESVISYSTDGVFVRPYPFVLQSGDGLGQWGTPERVTDLTVVGSGVYTYKNKKGDWHVKFRGFSPAIDLATLLYRAGSRHSIGIPVLRNTSLRLSYLRKSPQEMNVLRQITRYLDVNFDSKRVWPKRWGARELLLNQFESKPYIYYGKVKVKMYE